VAIAQVASRFGVVFRKQSRRLSRADKRLDQLYAVPAGRIGSIIVGAMAFEQDRRTIRKIVSRSNSGLLIRACTHKSRTLIDVRLAPTSGAKADIA